MAIPEMSVRFESALLLAAEYRSTARPIRDASSLLVQRLPSTGGVELGKSLAPEIKAALEGGASVSPDMQGLMAYIRHRN